MNYFKYVLLLYLVLNLIACKQDDEEQNPVSDNTFTYALSESLLDNPSATLALLIHDDAGQVVYHQVQDTQYLKEVHTFEKTGDSPLHATFIREYYLPQGDTLYEIRTLADIQNGDIWEGHTPPQSGIIRTIKFNVQGIQSIDSLRLSHFNNFNARLILTGDVLQLTFNRYEDSYTYVLIAANGVPGYRYLLDRTENDQLVAQFSQLPSDLRTDVFAFPGFKDWNGNIRIRDRANPEKYLRVFHLEREPGQFRPPLMEKYRYYVPVDFEPMVYDFELQANGKALSIYDLQPQPVLTVDTPTVAANGFEVFSKGGIAVQPNDQADVFYTIFTLGEAGVIDMFQNTTWTVAASMPRQAQRIMLLPEWPAEVQAAMPAFARASTINKVEVEVANLSEALPGERWQQAGSAVFEEFWKKQGTYASRRFTIQ